MSERREGFYWVKFCNEWTTAEWLQEFGQGWYCTGMEGTVPETCFDQIGSRIPTPDEPWATVPVEPTSSMKQAADYDTPGPMTAWKCWQVMLDSAPKP